jgi:hypothetical protein
MPAHELEGQPAQTVIVRAGIPDQIGCDTGQPLHADRVQPCLLESGVQLGAAGGGRPMCTVNGVVMKAPPQRQPVAERAEPAE